MVISQIQAGANLVVTQAHIVGQGKSLLPHPRTITPEMSACSQQPAYMQDSCCSPRPTFTVALPFCHLEFRAPRPKSDHYPKELNSLGDHIRARRLNLKLLQKQVAEEIGVHEQTITGWEGNATIPDVRYMPAIIQFLGYNPFPEAMSPPERLAGARKALGLSQRKMAAKLGVDPATIMGWEAGKHQPTGKSLELIGNILQSW